MSFCSHCGNKLKKGDRFCTGCGMEVAGTTSESRAAPSGENRDSNTGADVAYKGVGIRLVAHLVDVILVFIAYYALGSMIAGYTGGVTDEGFELEGGPALLLMLIMFVVSMGYFILLEAKWNGQTLGKKIAGIRVANGDDGGRASVRQTTIRNLLRIVDVLPFFYIVGVILVWTGDKKQRLGDRVAKTVVLASSRESPDAKLETDKKSRIKFSMGRGSGYLDT